MRFELLSQDRYIVQYTKQKIKMMLFILNLILFLIQVKKNEIIPLNNTYLGNKKKSSIQITFTYKNVCVTVNHCFLIEPD